jgi:ERCC4-type nuclease
LVALPLGASADSVAVTPLHDSGLPRCDSPSRKELWESLGDISGGVAFGTPRAGGQESSKRPGKEVGRLGADQDSFAACSTPPKRSRVAIAKASARPPAGVAAAQAALARQALFESSRMASAQPIDAVDVLESGHEPSEKKLPRAMEESYSSSDENEATISAKPRKCTRQEKAESTNNAEPIVLSLTENESDDDSTLDSILSFRPFGKKPPLRISSAGDPRTNHATVDLTSPTGMLESRTAGNSTSSSLTPVTILIDRRERNRNATPRILKTELDRLLTAGSLHLVWPYDTLHAAKVDECTLPSGDFSIVNTPVVVERKRISDLVQRSARDAAHWEQLLRMREMKHQGYFLLEGALQTAGQFQAFGIDEEEDMKPTSLAIYNDDSLVRFMGRALFLSKTGFIQSKDEQGSLRIVGSLAVMACLPTDGNVAVLNPYASPKVNIKLERSKVIDRLSTQGNIPLPVATRVADVLGTLRELDRLYSDLPNDLLRDWALETVIGDTADGLERSTSSAADWSIACHRVYQSVDTKKTTDFTHIQSLVSNPAKLLVALLEGASPDDAVEQVLGDPDPTVLKREVIVSIPEEHHELRDYFAEKTGAFYRLSVSSPATTPALPAVLLSAHLIGLGCSSEITRILVLEGSKLVRMVQRDLQSGKGCFAQVVRYNCSSSRLI